MKKILLLPLLILPMMTACDTGKTQEKVSLTYGTVMEKSNSEAIKELSNSELLAKTRDENEVFLLAVYQDQYSETCNCWITYKEIIQEYCFKYNRLVYLYNAHNQTDELAHLKIEKLNESTPYLYIYNGEKLIKKFSHANNRYRRMFEDTSAVEMNNLVNEYVNRPHLYFSDEEHIKNDEQTVMFMRHGCSDCKYALDNVLIPYIKERTIGKDVYLFDMQKYYDIAKNPDASEEEKACYQNLKDKYGLSEAEGNPFGYQQGVVPTIQYRKGGKAVAAAVYFNDTVEKREDGSYFIADSFYSEERKESLKDQYTFPNVIKGMTLTEGVIEGNNNTYYWSQSAANKYHKANFEAFLDCYISAEVAA